MNKNQTYGTANCIPRLHYLLCGGTGEGHKKETLTTKEKRLSEILSKTNGQDLFSVSVRKKLSSGKLGCLKEVIEMLKQQYQDCGRQRMIEVLGEDAVTILETFS